MKRTIARVVLALFYAVAGIIHLVKPGVFMPVMPSWVPFPMEVIVLTGVAEILGAIALVQPFSIPLRKAGAIGLALYAVCVFPANINHFMLDMAKADGGAGLAYHVPRMFAQPVIVWLALWAGGVTNWPFGRRHAR